MKQISALLLLVLASVAVGQSTKPVESDDLRRINQSLQAQIATLKEQVAELTKQLKAAQGEIGELRAKNNIVTIGKRIKPESTFESRAEVAIQRGGPKDFPPKDAREVRENAKKIDANIEKYLSTHEVSAEIQKAIWSGDVVIGEKEEQLKLYGRLEKPSVETATAKVVYFTPWSPYSLPVGYMPMSVTISANGEVTLIQR